MKEVLLNAAKRWRAGLLAWAIPEEIVAAAPESPWGFPSQLFAARTSSAMNRPLTTSHKAALAALGTRGTVLDVGVGGGAGSLPMAAAASIIIGVDSSPKMLESFAQAAVRAGVRAETILGSWPDSAGDADPCEVVVCHHVLFNVPDLPPFASALNDKAHNRVVLELTPVHPLAWMSDLWLTFHNLERPKGPDYTDAIEVLVELGFDVRSEVSEGPPVMSGFPRREDAVALVRKRLCLQPDQDERLAEALGERLVERDGLWSAAPPNHSIVTLHWDPVGGLPKPKKAKSS